ncbi:MAG: flagellar protein [Firmicutes bacterium]|nr:flagellar protein [Bacillota bacterium]
MTNRLPRIPRQITPERPLSRPDVGRSSQRGQTASFQSILEERLQTSKLKFSRHAEARMRLRNVKLSEGQLTKLTQAVELAQTKGSKESLIIMEDNVFVVSVKNGTVITVVDRDSAKENVFTQIDSAILTD